MSSVKSHSAVRRFGSVLLALLGCVLLLDAAGAQEAQLITLAGQKQMLTRAGSGPVGAREKADAGEAGHGSGGSPQAGCDHRRILRLQLPVLQTAGPGLRGFACPR